MKKNNIVVLLGAGASVDAGLPTSQNLSEIIYNDILADNLRNKDHTRLLGYVISRLKARNARLGRSPYAPIEVEELFDALNSLANKDTLLVSEFVERWDRSLDDLYDSFDGGAIRKQFQALVAQSFQKMQKGSHVWDRDADFEELARRMQPSKTLTKNFQGVPLFQRPFFGALYKNLSVEDQNAAYLEPILNSQNVSLIASLNYDLAMEKCAVQLGRNIDYGLDAWEQQKIVRWRGNDDIKLLKLHGSLNWSGSPEDITVREDEISQHENRVMIFGGISNKLSAEGPFLQFLSKLENGFNNADTILIVVYSFRDAHINALLSRRRMTKRKTKIVVIDPVPPPLGKIGFHSGDVTRERSGRKYTYTLDLNMILKGAKEGLNEFFA